MIAGRNEYSVTNCAVIVLAAGGSTRLGRPKQLLSYNGTSLLQHTIDAARQSTILSIIVVLGSDHESINKNIDVTGLHVVRNDNWQTGMASSIICGIKSLERIAPGVDGAILMACDQPFINAALLDDLLLVQKASNKPIVASRYKDTIGIPALFHKEFFGQLLDLEGDKGAKKLMNQSADCCATVPFPLGSIDIDTLDDYEALLK